MVVGGGVMGSATAWWLAREGAEVTLVEQFGAGHERGSSHGSVRIFRLAYADDTYVQLALEAEPLWRELEEEADEDLLVQNGAIDHGDPRLVGAVAENLERHGIAHERLAVGEAEARFPGMKIEEGAVFHDRGGAVFAARTVRSLHRVAAARGAEVAFEEPAVAIHERDGGVVVETGRRELTADVVVVAAGGWVSSIVGDLVPLPPTRVTVEQPGWFAPKDPAVPWPSFIHYTSFGAPAGESAIEFGAYGLVDPGLGLRDTWPGNAVKVGEERVPTVVDPADGPFPVDKAALGRLADYIAAWMPGLDPTALHAETCLFTTTPTNDFVLDRRGPIVVASPCSGHGFKFAPLIGRMVADLALGRAEARAPFLLP